MLYDAVLIFSIVLLAANIGTRLWVRSFFIKRIFFFNVLLVCVFLSYMTYLQYRGWAAGPPTSYLLPPTTPIFYFIEYVFYKLWISYIISFFCALLAIFGLSRLNAARGNMLLREHEQWTAGSAILLSGFPGVILFIPVFFTLFCALTLFHTIREGKKTRVSAQFLWLPTALCGILIVYLFLSKSSWWVALRP